MIVTLEPNAKAEVLDAVLNEIGKHKDIRHKVITHKGAIHDIVEILLFGDTARLDTEQFNLIDGVRRAIRVQSKYRVIGRHADKEERAGFDYNGVTLGDGNFLVFPGLCAVDSPESVEAMFKALKARGIQTSRMGAYKPRTSPYDFQGLGKDCLPYVFNLAAKYDIKIVSMEVCEAGHIEEIREALKATGNKTGVMLQIGTRNAQNFELLKAAGKAHEFPVLFKRGMGITLEESLNACEYIASEGNPNVIFCLRGVKTHLGTPHRNLVDFAHVPVVKRRTRLPVCIDPSHSVGTKKQSPDGIPDIFHATAQGVVSGADMILVDFHPFPEKALCDGLQALTMDQLDPYLNFVQNVRDAYVKNVKALTMDQLDPYLNFAQNVRDAYEKNVKVAQAML